jgi:hypothetical protein
MNHDTVPLEDNRVDLVNDENVDRDEDTSGGTVPDTVGEERERRAEVHGVIVHVEGEASDSLLLQDTEVVTKVGSINTKSIILPPKEIFPSVSVRV